MISSTDEKNQQIKITLLKCVLFFLPVLFIWQGLDFTDMGFLLSNALFFDQPGVIQDMGVAHFLTNFIGWFWLKLTSPLGLLGARFGWCVIFWGIFYFSNKILSQLMPEWRASAFLSITFLFGIGNIVIGYNCLSALFALMSVCLIVKAEAKDTNSLTAAKLLFIAGICSGLNIFVRMPNVLMISFALIPVVTDVISNGALPDRKSWSKCAAFLCGWGSAVVTVFVLMVIFGHFDSYAGALTILQEQNKVPNGQHGINLTLSLFKRDHKEIFKFTVKFLSVISIAALPIALLPQKAARYVVALFAAGFLLHWGFAARPRRHYVYVIAGICYLISAIKLACLCNKHGKRETAIYLSALGMFILVPLGSNNGITNAVYGSWLLLPIALELLCKSPSIINDFTKKRGISERMDICLSNAFLIGGRFLILIPFLYISLHHAWTYTYRDSADRASMIYPLEHSKLRYTYTTRERAAVVNELMREMDGYVGKYEYLFAFDSAITLHYIYAWKPYLYSSWPVVYEPHQFEAAMRKAEQEHTLPLVVITKETLQTFNWPRLQNPWINNSARYKAGREIVADFMTRNNYSKQWENATFEIWTYD